MRWGSIHENSIDEILQNEGLDELVARSAVLKAGECQGCHLFPLCHGGCPIDGYVHSGSFSRKTIWCAGKKRFVAKYFEPITSLRVENLAEFV
jgi:radical SAM protein with 4Fe4S-binding SPASM domain